ncbi:GntR family transcriptional regulator [Actinomadura mexicana]|uniref:GntR family transcriptional regulator n=1 Tax=Actinomadura mexicana TaxID=134959 RepID=A0A239EW92_9ACTN|nr:GntR family transcriptional regulator [Actinomadura mexicana]SNS48946.1 GntR family transcriptional regulator [Actinomadura mexicana]
MVDRDQQSSPYQAIADDLQSQIKSGDLSPDSPLPSAQELAQRWDCELSAARRALIALRNVGAIYFLAGQGAFVAKNPPLVRTHWDRFQRPHAQPAYRQESDRAGMELHMEHSTERAEAPAGVAERLGIDEGDPVTETSYAISMGGSPVSFSVAWEPLAITGGTEIESPHEGPYRGQGIVPRFDAIGYAVDVEEEVLQVRMPEPHEEAQLDIPAGVPVIQIWQTFWAGDTPVEVAKIIYRADRYEFQYRTKID